MTEQTKWMAIANPISGFGSVRKKWNAIKAELELQKIDFDFEFTTPDCKGDDLVRNAIKKGYRKIISVGGDGHLHDVVNGIMTQKEVASTDITIGMISLGTGNDWIKTNKIPKDYKKAIALLKAEKTYIQNVGYAVADNNGNTVSRYFHNFAGVGFDAYVVERTMSSKAYGQVSYLLVMLRCLFSYRLPVLRMTFDHAVVETPCYLTLTGIGQYGGGGMKLTPGAKPDGDSFYTSIAKNFSKLDVFRYIGKLYDGSFIHLDKAETHTSKHVKIEVISSEAEVYMESDGDIMGTGPFEISLIPQALKVVIP
jgi:YegS/Rv2252/BmrU family lipid kinase